MSISGVFAAGGAWLTLGYVHAVNSLAARPFGQLTLSGARRAETTPDPSASSQAGNTAGNSAGTGSGSSGAPTQNTQLGVEGTPAPTETGTGTATPTPETIDPGTTTPSPFPSAAAAPENPVFVFLRFIVGIVVVFLLLWLLWRWFKRMNLGDYEGPGLRMVSRLQLSRSAQVAVVEIGGRMFLVGAGDSAVTPIAEIYDTEEMSAELSAAAKAYEERTNAPARRPFGEVLAKATRKSVAKDASKTPRPVRAIEAGPGGKGAPAGKNTGAAGGAGGGKGTKSGKGGTGAKAMTGSAGVTGKPALKSGTKPGNLKTAGVAKETPKPKSQVTEAQMDALAAQIAAEFGAKGPNRSPKAAVEDATGAEPGATTAGEPGGAGTGADREAATKATSTTSTMKGTAGKAGESA